MREFLTTMIRYIMEQKIVKRFVISILGIASNSWIEWLIAVLIGRFMDKVVEPMIMYIARKGIRLHDAQQGKHYYIKLQKDIDDENWNGVKDTLDDLNK